MRRPPGGFGEGQSVKQLFSRHCWNSDNYGCSKGSYCWARCRLDRRWCWTVNNWGLGRGRLARLLGDCLLKHQSVACSRVNCKECGCVRTKCLLHDVWGAVIEELEPYFDTSGRAAQGTKTRRAQLVTSKQGIGLNMLFAELRRG